MVSLKYMPFLRKYRLPVLAVILVAVLPGLYSCTGSLAEEEITVVLRHGEVGAEAGSQFVTVQASGDWSLSISYLEGESGWASVTPQTGSGDRSSIVLEYMENTFSGPRSLAIVLTSGGSEAQCTLVQKAAGSQQEPDVPDVPSAGGVPGWMELPAVEAGDGLRFVTHDMTVGGIPTRNYSLLWNDACLAASWVAYPLSRWTIGTEDVGRTDDWQYDPEIPQEYQPCLFKGFPSGGSYGYDRGHQIPSADRQNRDSNRQTFYFTNMTPQLSSFNQKIWASLESHVRNIAGGTDTLYVVTGCVVGEGSPEIAYDNEGKAVTVPSAYYKALLKYQKSGSTTGIGGYSAAGYYLEHRAYSQDSIDGSMLVSIDRLEELTGIDFFVNLASVLGDRNAAEVEAEIPAERLWL